MKDNIVPNKLLKKISSEEIGACYVCEYIFNRIRLTGNWCYYCHGWFCEEHGTFAGKKIPYCVVHDEKLRKKGEELKVQKK